MVRKAALGSRVLLGVIFLVFGLNFFLHFLPLPPPENPAAQAFMGGLWGTGYFFQFMKTVEIVGGLALITGYFAPLALTVLAPIVLNIALYHRLLAGGPPIDLLMLALGIVAAYGYREAFRGVLQARAPIASDPSVKNAVSSIGRRLPA